MKTWGRVLLPALLIGLLLGIIVVKKLWGGQMASFLVFVGLIASGAWSDLLPRFDQILAAASTSDGADAHEFA
jgi:hypothetical protein